MSVCLNTLSICLRLIIFYVHKQLITTSYLNFCTIKANEIWSNSKQAIVLLIQWTIIFCKLFRMLEGSVPCSIGKICFISFSFVRSNILKWNHLHVRRNAKISLSCNFGSISSLIISFGRIVSDPMSLLFDRSWSIFGISWETSS
jgi:hypothetical protein